MTPVRVARPRRLRTLCTGAACIGALTALAATARAHADELLWRGGDAMLRYGHSAGQDAPRSISINGAELHIASGRSQSSLEDVLDVFERRCKRSGGDYGGQLRRAGATRNAAAERGPLLDGVLRRSAATRGVVACFDLGARPVSAIELLQRLRAFVRSGDIAEIGELRVVWADQSAGTASYLAVSSRGSVPLRAMFPRAGDAPGTDAPGLPRPARSRRMLSAGHPQRAPLLVAYRSELTPMALRAAYRAQLQTAGFAVQVDRTAADGSRQWLVRRGAALSAVVIAADGSGSTLVLSPWP